MSTDIANVLYPSAAPVPTAQPTSSNLVADIGDAPAATRTANTPRGTGGGLPRELAGVRLDETRAASVTDYRAVIPAKVPNPALLEDGLRAALAAGVGITQMSALVNLERQAIAAGDSLTVEAGSAAVRAMWGDRADANTATVRKYIAGIAKQWPEIVDWLEGTRLGNYAPFIRLVYEKAKTRY